MNAIKIADVMKRRVLTAGETVTTTDALQSMAHRKVGSIVVTRGKKPIGIFTEHDLLYKVLNAGKDPASTPIGDVMTRDIVTLSPESGVEEAFQKMQRGNFRHILVCVEDRIVGILSVKDLIRTRQRFLEQLVSRKTSELQDVGDRLAESLQILRRDMTLAGNVQRQLIDTQPPQIDGVRFTSCYHQAQSLGGDFFSILRLSPTRIGVFVGDVMGHGIASAFIAMSLRHALDSIPLHKLSPSRAIRRLNAHMIENSLLLDAYFVAGCYLDINIKDRSALYTQFGLPLPGVYRAQSQTFEKLPPSDTPIGIRLTSEYPEHRIQFHQGDILLLFTDGCSEQKNPSDTPYGETRFVREFLKMADARQTDFSQTLYDRVLRFAGSSEIADDIAILTLQWT